MRRKRRPEKPQHRTARKIAVKNLTAQAGGGGVRPCGRHPKRSIAVFPSRSRRPDGSAAPGYGAGEHEGKRLRPVTVELSRGSTLWRHGDLRPLLHEFYQPAA